MIRKEDATMSLFEYMSNEEPEKEYFVQQRIPRTNPTKIAKMVQSTCESAFNTENYRRNFQACLLIFDAIRRMKVDSYEELCKAIKIQPIGITNAFTFMANNPEIRELCKDIETQLAFIKKPMSGRLSIDDERINLIVNKVKLQPHSTAKILCETIGFGQDLAKFKKWVIRINKNYYELRGIAVLKALCQGKGNVKDQYELIKDELVMMLKQKTYRNHKEIAVHYNIPVETMRQYILRAYKEEKGEGKMLMQKNEMDKNLQLAKTIQRVADYKLENPFKSCHEIGVELNINADLVHDHLQTIQRQWKAERTDSFEAYLKYVTNDLHKIKAESWKRFHASPQSSSRWLEINIMAIDREMKLLGLGNTSKIEVTSVQESISKEQRDSVIEAWTEAQDNLIDITPKQLANRHMEARDDMDSDVIMSDKDINNSKREEFPSNAQIEQQLKENLQFEFDV